MKFKKSRYIFILKLVIVCTLIGYLAHKVKNASVLEQLKILKVHDYIYITGCIFLMFFNWGLEAFKWKLLVQKIENLSWLESIKSVLAGLASGLLTPNRVGNFVGRLAFIKKENHNKALINTLIGNLAQFLSTILGNIWAFFKAWAFFGRFWVFLLLYNSY